jgi:proline iminopeptidase
MNLLEITTIVSTAISVVGLFVALVAVWVQTWQNNRALGVTILRDLEKDFLWSDEMISKRLTLATYLLRRKSGDPRSAEVAYMLDFFDSIGLYHNKHVIDTEMTWVMFYYWLGHYWNLLKADADTTERLEDGIKYYKNIRILYKRLTDFGRKHRNLPPEEQYYSPENLRAFLIREFKDCSPPGTKLPPDLWPQDIATPMIEEGYAAVTGGKIWYRVVGRGNRTPLLVIHGGPGYAHNYLRPLEELANTRPVIFYDQLGSGRSDWPEDTRLWRVERFREELEHLRKAVGVEQMHLLGHSWGSLLAVEYYLACPNFVQSMILASPCLSTTHWIADASELIKQLPEQTRNAIEFHQSNGTTNSEEYTAAAREYERRFLLRLEPTPAPVLESKANTNDLIYSTMWGPSEFHITGTLQGYDCTTRLPELACPVLLTCGEYDEATPSTTHWYSSLIPNAKVIVFEKSAHMSHLEETDAYLKAVQQFLNPFDSI